MANKYKLGGSLVGLGVLSLCLFFGDINVSAFQDVTSKKVESVVFIKDSKNLRGDDGVALIKGPEIYTGLGDYKFFKDKTEWVWNFKIPDGYDSSDLQIGFEVGGVQQPSSLVSVVDGVVEFKLKDGSYSDLIKDNKLSVAITIVSADEVLNSFSETYNYKDKGLELTKVALSGGNLQDGTYYSSKGVGLEYTLNDNTLKGKIELLNNGVKVDELALKGDLKGTMSIKSTGEYTLKVYDDVFNPDGTVIALDSLVSGLQGNKVVVSKDEATLNLKAKGVYESSTGVVYIKDINEGSVDIEAMAPSDVGLKEYVITLNGVEIIKESLSSSTFKETLKLSDYASIIGDSSKVAVGMQATTQIGIVSSGSVELVVDKTQPQVTLKANGTYTDDSNKVYVGSLAQGSVDLKFSLANSDLGLRNYIVKVNGKVIKDEALARAVYEGRLNLGDFAAAIGSAKTLDIEVEVFSNTGVANSSSVVMVVDDTKPSVDVVTKGVYTDKDGKVYISGDLTSGVVSLGINTTSKAVGLKNYTLKLNGTQVESKEVNGTTTTLEFKLSDYASVVGKADKVTIEVEGTTLTGISAKGTGTIYIDKDVPVIDEINVSGDGVKNGSLQETLKGVYGYFIRGEARVQLKVYDKGNIVSGVKQATYKLFDSNLKETSKGVLEDKGSGIYEVTLPSNFKGFISVNAVDNVGNLAKEKSSEGIITEDEKTFLNTHTMDVVLPKPKREKNGIAYYNSNIPVFMQVKNAYMGIAKVEWSVGDTNLGKVEISKDGKLSGVGSNYVNIIGKQANLVVDLSLNAKIEDEFNGQNIGVWVYDNAGNRSKYTKKVTLDKTKPKVSVAYSDGKGATGEFINYNKTATFTVEDANFDKSLVRTSGIKASNLHWETVADNTYQASYTWAAEGDYKYTFVVEDLATNVSRQLTGSFEIDKTAPVLVVSDDGSARNGKYYKNNRNFTFKVVEKNFNPKLVTTTGLDNFSGFKHVKGYEWIGNATFSKDGNYSFSVGVEDKAGNKGKTYSSGEFVIDKTDPVLTISGVENGQSFNNSLMPVVSFKDTNLDFATATVVNVSDTSKTKGVQLVGSKATGKFTLNNLPKEKEYDGEYLLKAEVGDLAGNKVAKELTFYVNRFGSDFSESNYKGKYIQEVSSDVVIKENSVTKHRDDKVKVYQDLDSKVLQRGVDYNVKVKDKKGYIEVDYVINKDLFKDDGKYSIEVESVDKSKDKSISTDTLSLSFVVDTQAPDVSTGLKDGGVYKEPSITEVIEVEDNTLLKNYIVEVDGVKAHEAEYSGKPEITILDGTMNKEKKTNEEQSDVKSDWNRYNLKLGNSTTPQKVKVSGEDFAGNKVEKEYNVLVTTDTVTLLLYKVANNMFIVVVGGLLVLALGVLVGVKIHRRKE